MPDAPATSLYNPPAFREERPGELRAMIGAARLALLACNGADGVPALSHLPMVLAEEEGPHGTLYGHLARANPQLEALRAAGRAVAVFPGPDAYVSPAWYPSKREHGRVVPTWNYEAVHAEGTVALFGEPERLLPLLHRLTDRHEAGRAAPWSVADAPAAFVQGQMKGILGVALRIERLSGKRKLSQNKPEAERQGVLDGLSASGDAADRAVAAAMRRV